MRCVQIDGLGFVVDVVPQPADTSACTLAIGSPLEFGHVFKDIATLSISDGGRIATAVIAIWAIGWVIGQARLLGSQRHD